MKTTCAHCHTEYDLSEAHDCTPSCYHCGKVYGELENPEYDSEKIAISRHQRECDEPPESWDRPIQDPEAEFRKNRRERKRRQQQDRRIEKLRRMGRI